MSGKKVILITGATDGIGLLTAQKLAQQGHTLLLHGRNAEKLDQTVKMIGGTCEGFIADFSNLEDVARLADHILKSQDRLDIVINNAGVYKTPTPYTSDGLDARFVVNTIAPYLLTKRLLPVIPADGRIINLSSAAQAPVSIDALEGRAKLDDMSAYAQSKLGITIWSQQMAKDLPDGPVIIPVNPGSLLASKMVKQGFGVEGSDLNIGADILIRLAIDPDHASRSGHYFDNDAGRYGHPHAAASKPDQIKAVMASLDSFLG